MNLMTKRIQNLGWTSLCLAILALAGAGCSKAGSTSTVSSVTYLSVINGAPFSSAANVYLNDTLITATAINPGAYSPKYGTIRPGSYGVKFKKAGTDSLFDQLIPSPYDTLNFYTILLYNDPGGKAAHLMKIFDDFSGVSNNNNAYYRFFHLAPDWGPVNVTIGGSVVQTTRTPADNAVNGAFNAFQPVPAGSTTIKVTDANTDSVLVTSGTINLGSGNPYTIWITGTKALKNLTLTVLPAQY